MSPHCRESTGLSMTHLLEKYGARSVPRYTSYPTAPHFCPSDTPPNFEALNKAAPVSLYAHVAYCRQMCWYCGCNMKLANRYDLPIERYKNYLLKELDLLRQSLPAKLALNHLHWGGGTPTVLKPEDLAHLMGAISDVFHIQDDAELAIECDPRGVKR